jgi:ABC-2 type transport system ATP-binding protein
MDNSLPIMASGLTKHYREVTAVRDLSLSVGRGEIYGFLGLNGAGKTTTIRMLLGMVRPSEGAVSLFGTRISPGERSIWKRVGYLVETAHAYPDLTVRQNLEITRRLHGTEDKDAVDRIMDDLSITEYAERKAGKLSLGNAQRLGLAKALMHRPELLLLDEPTNGLDPAGIVEIRNLLQRMAQNDGVTVFVSSHILAEVAKLATRIGIIHEGKLVRELDTVDLRKEQQNGVEIETRDMPSTLAFLRGKGIAANKDSDSSICVTDAAIVQNPDRLATILVEGGFAPTKLLVRETDLESYFLSIVGMNGAKQ